jgi:hypothetical protein
MALGYKIFKLDGSLIKIQHHYHDPHLHECFISYDLKWSYTMFLFFGKNSQTFRSKKKRKKRKKIIGHMHSKTNFDI